jgi:hypothetical protein
VTCTLTFGKPWPQIYTFHFYKVIVYEVFVLLATELTYTKEKIIEYARQVIKLPT